MKSLSQLIELQNFLHAFQSIERVVDVPEREARENDVEHSYHLAMAGWFLAESFPELDRDKIIRYSLIHDIVEIHAGDTFFYADKAQLDTKVDREAKSLEKIKSDWVDFPGLSQSIEAYESKQDQEAKFVYALDKIMPIIVIMNAGGKTWKDHGITVDVLRRAKEAKVAMSPQIVPYFNELLNLLENQPELFAK